MMQPRIVLEALLRAGKLSVAARPDYLESNNGGRNTAGPKIDPEGVFLHHYKL